jgi:hypothetical protein
MNVLRRISEEMLNKVVALAITKERATVLKAVSKVLAQEDMPTKVVWQQLPPLLLRATVLRAGVSDEAMAKLLTGTWLRHSRALRDAVWPALQAQGYAPPGPAPEQPVERPSRLREPDLRIVPNPEEAGRRLYFFWPAGQPLLQGQQDEAVALMAHLLGWSVLHDIDEAPAPDSPPADALLPNDPVLATELQARLLATMQATVAAHHAGTFQPAADPLADKALQNAEALVGFVTDLAGQLTLVADQLRAGTLPAHLLDEVNNLTFLHTMYEETYIRLASHLGPVVLPPPVGRTVAALATLAATVREASNGPAVRATALRQLARLGQLRHRSIPDFAPLLEVQRQAEVLQEELLASPEATPLPAAATALHLGTHPFATLLQLAADAEALEELDEQSVAFQALEEALPRAVVTALLLRKLEVVAATEPAIDSAPAAASGAESQAEAVLATEALIVPVAAPEANSLPVTPETAAILVATPETPALPAADAATWLPPLQWQLLNEPRLALAWHLTQAAGSPAGALPAELLHALLLAPALRHPTGPLASALQADFSRPPAAAGSPHPLATGLLEMTVALRPALLAPTSQATAWLAAELPQLPALQALRQLVTSREAPTPLLPERVFMPPAQAAWATRMDEWRTALEAWQTTATTASYRQSPEHPATLGWQHLLLAGQPGGQLLAHLRARGPAAPLLPLVRAASAELASSSFIETRLQAAGFPLSTGHPARRWLRETLDELLDLAYRWHYLRSIQPGRGGLSHVETQDKAFCQKLAAALPAARQELAALWPVADEQLRAALPWAEAALAQLHTLLHQPAPASPELTVSALMQAPLLPYATLPLDLTGRLPAPAAAWLPALHTAAHSPEPSWTEAFASHLGRGQHQATARILARPGAGIGASGEALALLHEAHANGLEDQKQALAGRGRQLRKDIEFAAQRGQLTPEQRADLLHQHTQYLHQSWQYDATDYWNLDYAALHQAINATEARLRALEASAELRYTPGPTNLLFTQFFPQQLRLLEQELESHPLPELLSRLAQGGTVAGTALHAAPPEARAAASQALGAWEELRAERQLRAAQMADVELLMHFLGFENVSVSLPPRPFQGPDVADVTATPVAEGTRCPVAHYGSAAAGRYRLVLVWQKVSEAAHLLDEVRKGADETLPPRPIILFYFNSLAEPQRHDLAAASRQRQQTVLVLDRTLLVYLTTAGLLHPDRLPVFFQLALPFTWLEPFPSQAPELFVGRHYEQDLLMAATPDSPCIVLGEPGTGKTMLLRQLATRHQPETDQLVLLISVGQLSPPDRLAGALEHEVKRRLLPYGILPAGMAASLTFPKMLRYVRTWMRSQPERRLVLLLDDVSELVAQELALGTPLLKQFAELIAETDVRFKLVMSCRQWPDGLPIEQYLQLGPLLGPGDAGAAETLLRRPLETLGAVFEDELAVTEALVETGYFPAQLQLLGQQLLAHLYAQELPAAGERPAHRLGFEEVRGVIRSVSAELTVHATPLIKKSTHHYLAFLLLSYPEAHEQYAGAPGRGFLPEELFAASHHYWPQGFGTPETPELAEYLFLLTEFTTMGITLRSADGRYFLAEAYWLKLGSSAEMAEQLAEFADLPLGSLATPAPASPTARPTSSKTSMLKRLTNGRRRL